MLFCSALIWGTSFFIMKNALDAVPVFFLLAIRFTAGAVLLALVCWLLAAATLPVGLAGLMSNFGG